MVAALSASLALLALVLVYPLPAPAQPLDFSGVDEAAEDAVASGQIPGAVVLIGRGDEVLHERAYGSRATVPERLPMRTDTIFDIASLTKPIGTTLAIMSLVERGAIGLDAPVGRYVREFRSAEFRTVTIRRLLTHSAGLPPDPPKRDLRVGFPRAARKLAHLKLDYAPGREFEYSDTGFILLGEVVRRVSGQRLDQYLASRVFKPLGLLDTGFLPRAALRPRIAPTQWHDGRMLQGEVHDPAARALRGVAGDAGIFSTAGDLAHICQMLVRGGLGNGHRILKATTIRAMWTRSSEGNGTRALGWDVSSTYSRIMAPYFPIGSVGHTGYTGTSIWIDPPTETYLILLTNRVHPDGGGSAAIHELRIRVAAAAGAQLFQQPPPPADTSPRTEARPKRPAVTTARAEPLPRVRTGLDVLVDERFATLEGQTVGVITNQTGIDARGRRTIDLLAEAPGVHLRAIFSPEHGLTGDRDTDIPDSRDAATGLPIWSLYGRTRRPSAATLEGLTTLVFDIQDVGARYYTYLATLTYVLEAAARHSLRVVVLDRPDPITGRVVEGPLTDPDLESFTAPHAIPVRTGLTMGEFARMVAAERKIPVSLVVVPMTGWERGRWYDQTGLPWVNPSPNIRSLTQALLYSGIGLLEATNVSVGRGTDTPFEVVGAPWIEPYRFAETLNAKNLRGVRFEPAWFTPMGDRYARTLCGGVRLVVTDRDAIRPVTVALAIGSALRAGYRADWRPERVQNLLVNRSTMWAFLRGEPLERLTAWAEMERQSFLNRRASYLIYP